MDTAGVDHFNAVCLATFVRVGAMNNPVFYHYCLLGDDTAMPAGLHARLCHAFLVIRVCN